MLGTFFTWLTTLILSVIVLYTEMSRKVSPTSAATESADERWEAFKAEGPKLQPQSGWTRRDIPHELQTIEDDSAIPEKLDQILAWSLTHRSSPPTTTTSDGKRPAKDGREFRGPEESTTIVSPQALSDDIGLGPVATPKTTPSGPSDSQSVHSERHSISTSSSEKLRFKARHIGNSMFGTTLDLITTFKNKIEKDHSSASNHKRALQWKHSAVECTSCFDDIPKNEATKLPCNHSYCKPCLTTLITTSLQSEANFPPKCCLTEIPLTTVLSPLNTKQRETYKAKAAEYAVPAQDRWYCPNTKCLKWISPGKLHRVRVQNQKCPHCSTKICGICRGLAHGGSSECPQDYGLEATMHLAELEGWRRCFRCRAMVERTVGCRHMTCKCGAQFCYSCGTKWRTCACTEFDDANRQAELRRRRGEREIVLDAEEAEIARIILRIEEAERQEAEERRREEERREEERQREEAELARLEQERVQEEESRRLAEEQMEQDFRRILRASVEESCSELRSVLNEITQMQRNALDSRHLEAEQHHIRRQETEMSRQQQENEEFLKMVESNIQKMTASIEERHTTELETFETEQQDLEDDFFLEIQLHLRGKKDKEAREKRLQEKFEKQQAERLQELTKRHQSQFEALKANATMERQGLRLSSEGKLARLEHKFRTEVNAQLIGVAADRAWFGFLSERRRNMVAANNRLMLEALDAGQEPVGLTEEEAMAIGPFISDFQDEATVTTTPLVTSPQTVASFFSSHTSIPQWMLDTHNDTLVAGDPSLGGPTAPSYDQMERNSAFAWMTGGNDGNNDPGQNSAAAERHTPAHRGRDISRRPHVRRMSTTVENDLLNETMSGVLLLAQQPFSPQTPGEVGIPLTSKISRRRVTPPSEGLQVLEPTDPPPPVPKVPAIYLPQTPHSSMPHRVPVKREQEEKEAVITSPVRIQRPPSNSSSSTAWTPSTSRSPSTATSRRSSSSVTSASRGSVDSLFLHTLVRTGTSKTSKSTHSPVSPEQPHQHTRSIRAG